MSDELKFGISVSEYALKHIRLGSPENEVLMNNIPFNKIFKDAKVICPESPWEFCA